MGDLQSRIDGFEPDYDISLSACYLVQVLREIKGLRWDCSTGPDDIPPIVLNLSQSIWHLLLHTLSTLVFQTRIIVMIIIIIIIIKTVYTQFQSRLELR